MRTQRRTRHPRRVALAALALATSAGAQAADCTLTHENTRVVSRVDSASTLTLDAGDEVKLIGALPPEPLSDAITSHTGEEAQASTIATPSPEAATRHALTALTAGKSVEIAIGGRRKDRYGRLLAHAFVGSGDERKWVQGELVESGYARAYALPGSAVCLDDLLRKERAARDARRGHWATGVFIDRDATSTRDLMALTGTFQTVTGEISQVSGGHGRDRGRLVLVFRSSTTRALSAEIATSSRDAPRIRRPPAGEAHDIHHLKGALVRVRGWIESTRTGPRIKLTELNEIEVLRLADPSPAFEPPPEIARPDLPPTVIPAGQ